MTVPVDTDALRNIARESKDFYAWSGLVAEAANELDRIRAVIDDAPHMTSCYTQWAWPKGRADAECDCWKADALG